MRKVFAATFAAGLMLVGGLAFTANSAMADPTTDCRSVTVNLADRPDTRPGGDVWAKNQMTRTMKVCATDDLVDEADRGSLWWYQATVTDAGTFSTVGGIKSPNGTVTLPAGVKGSVNGEFHAKFTAVRNWGGWDQDALGQGTPTSQWVKTAFPTANGDLISNYRWTYKTACEEYTDNNDVYSGDVTGKICAPTVEFTNATCKDAKAYLKVTNPNSHVTLAVAFNGTGQTVPKAGSVTHAFTEGVVLLEARQLRPKNYSYATPKDCPTASPTATPTATATVTPTATATPTATGTATATVSPTTSLIPVGNGGSLPVTGQGGGMNTPLLAGLGGVALIGIGGAMFLVARRRRDADTVESA